MQATRRQVMAALGGLAGLGLFGRCARAAADDTLVITTLGGVWEQFWRQSVAPAYLKHRNAEIIFDVGNGRVFTANLRTAGDKPPYSFVMTNEVFGSALRKEGYFEKLDLSLIPNYRDLYPVCKIAGDWAATCTISPIGIGYRTDLVKTPPKRWRDLWENPEFRGKIGLYNFANSAGKMTLLLASRIFGGDQRNVDAGFAALGKLDRVIQVDFNLSTMMASGEIIVAPFDVGEIVRLRKQGLPVACAVPEEGMLAFDQTFNVCRNGPAKALAYDYINFMLSPEIQTLLAGQFYTSPVNAKVEMTAQLKEDVPINGDGMSQILSWDWDFVNEHATEFSERWAKTLR